MKDPGTDILRPFCNDQDAFLEIEPHHEGIGRFEDHKEHHHAVQHWSQPQKEKSRQHQGKIVQEIGGPHRNIVVFLAQEP